MSRKLNAAPLFFVSAFLSLNFIFNTAWANRHPAQVITENSDFIVHKVEGIPYPLKFLKKSACNFSEREVSLLIKTFQALPPIYASLGSQFHFEKECVINLRTEKNTIENLSSLRIEAATSVHKAIVLSDRAFSYAKDGQLYQVSESLSQKLITHELTHELDKKFNYSGSEEFRDINGWSRNFGFMSYNKEKAEGFQREQGSDNPKEDLATQAEGFFFETDYICKHPQAYVWFYYWIGPSAVPTIASCPAEMNTPIDPAKVKDVGYIFISASDEYAESLFGHSLVRLHMDHADPLNDFAIEAAGNFANMPSLNGFETPDELIEKQEQAKKMKVSRLGFILKGASGFLELKVQRLNYKTKWIETLFLHGRDMEERILALTQLQRRVLVYLINKDIKNLNGNYNILTKNCASYLAQIINKAIGDDVAQKNAVGAYTPRNVYESFLPVVDKDLEMLEGDRTRLARISVRRQQTIRTLRENKLFSSVNLDVLEDPMDNISKTILQLDALVLAVRQGASQISQELKDDITSLAYSYTLERSLFLQKEATKRYAKIRVALKAPQ